VGDGAERTADEALDLLRAARRTPLGDLAIGTLRRRPRQHGVFGCHPALAATAHPRRHPFVDRRRAQHLGAPHGDEHRAHCELCVVALETQRAQVVGLSPVSSGAHSSYRSLVTARSTRSPYASVASARLRSVSIVGQMWVSISRRAPACRAEAPAWRALRCCAAPSWSRRNVASHNARSSPEPSASSDQPGPVSAEYPMERPPPPTRMARVSGPWSVRENVKSRPPTDTSEQSLMSRHSKYGDWSSSYVCSFRPVGAYTGMPSRP